MEDGCLAQAWISKSGPETDSVALGQYSQDTPTQPLPGREWPCLLQPFKGAFRKPNASGFYSGALSLSSLYYSQSQG